MMEIVKNQDLAELVGIILGDESFFINKKVAELDIAFNLSENYYLNHVEDLLQRITQSNVNRKYEKGHRCIHLRICKREIVKNLLEVSLIKSGNKIRNKVTIPEWIWKDKKLLKSCLKGLFDTDGSLYRLTPHWPNLFQLSFKNNNEKLLIDVRKALIMLNITPSKVFGNRIVVTKREEINKYFKFIGTSNLKYSPVV